MDVIGVVSKVPSKNDEHVFEWDIPGDRHLSDNFTYSSPVFPLSDTIWRINIQLKRDTVFEWRKHITLSLRRCDSGADKTVTYALRINRSPSFYSKFTKTDCFMQNCPNGKESFRIEDCIPQIWIEDSLTVICRINFESPGSVEGESFRGIPSCSFQTKAPDSGINVSNDEYFSSLDIKGITELSDCMKSMLMNSTDFDVKICVKNKEFHAHRNILNARSTVFARILTLNTEVNKTGTIKIEDCDPNCFDEFLLYVYSGRTQNLTPKKALQLY